MSSNGRQAPGAVRRWRRLAMAGAPVVLGLAASDAGAAQLYLQDFESLALQPFVSSTEGGGSGADWTDELPAGWARDNTTTPAGGPVEFFGFTFMNKDSWIATEVNQERDMFTRGTGAVMVSDPDAYDDSGNIDPNLYNAFIRTQPISLANVVPGSARLNFDSSFRPYDTMTASVAVSFDGGDNFINLLSMNSANVPGGDSSLERVDEGISLPLDNPAGAANAIIRFGMTEAGNDWWWAVDNIEVTGDLVPEPGAGLALLGLGGLAALQRRRRR